MDGHIVILDGYTINPGDHSWDPILEQGPTEVYDRSTREQAVQRARKADIVVTSKVEVDQEFLDQLPDLRFVALLATGYNQVDLQATAGRGIPVANVPGYSSPAVAQFAVGLLLTLCHRFEHHDAAVRDGEWTRRNDFCFWETPQRELDGRTLGIIGFGSIGRRVGRIASALGMRVLAFNPGPKPRPDYAPFDFADLHDLLSASDAVTLHCPLTEENHGMADADFFARMKPGAFFLNTARGGLVREPALIHALASGHLAGAALDVVVHEPLPPDDPLLAAPNLIVTPHMAWATLESRIRLVLEVAENIRAFRQGRPRNLVNQDLLPPDSPFSSKP